VHDAEACFRELYEHFAHASAWRLTEGTGDLLRRLADRGLMIGMASNYDARLRRVVAGFAELSPVQYLVISSAVGFRKPAREFFAAVVRSAACRPADVVHVGDDAANDYDAAIAAGLRAVLIGERPDGSQVCGVRSLHQVPEIL